MRRIVIRTILVLSIIISTGIAQSNGKIYGVITDAKSSQPIAGVRIFLDEREWEVLSDTSGFFILMPLPIGSYTMQVSHPDYHTVTISGIEIIGYEGTRLDIPLRSGSLVTSDSLITHTAIQADATIPYSYSRITADDIQGLPQRGLQNYMELQPGVVIQDEQVHIRGGRADETAYFINGLSTTNPLDYSNAVYIIPEAIDQIRILPGAYSSRHGGAISGIVLTDLRQGTSDFHFNLSVQTDKFAKAGERFLDTYSYRDQIVTATASGPVTDNIRFFAALENTGIGDAVKRFGKGFRFDDLVNEDWWYWPPRNDTLSIVYPDGFTPDNAQYRWAFNSNLNFEFHPFSMRIMFLYNDEQVYQNNTPVLNVLNNRAQYLDHNTLLLSAEMSHRISDRLYYSLGVSHYNNDTERLDDWFGNDWQAWDDSARVADYTQSTVTYRSRYREPRPYFISYFDFTAHGQTLENYMKSSQSWTDFYGSAEWQANAQLNLQAGFSWRQYNYRRYAVNQSAYMDRIHRYGWDENELWDRATDNVYGYDIRGREIDSGLNGPRQPLFANTYLNCGWQKNNTSINAGIRFEYIDTDDRYLDSPLYQYIGTTYGNININENAWQNRKGVYIGSPRLSIATNISKQMKLFLAYAKTVQAPALQNIYYDSRVSNRQIFGWYYYLQPVGFDMNLIHAQHVDLGVQYWFSDLTVLSINTYYKNTRGQARVQSVSWLDPTIIRRGQPEKNRYFKISNGDNAVIRGLDIGFSVINRNGLNVKLNYGYSSATGTGSNAISNYTSIYNQIYRFDTTAVNIAYNPLDFQVEHKFVFNVNYNISKNLEIPILRNSRLDLLMRMQSGHPYTRVEAWRYAYMGQWSADYERDRRSNRPQEAINTSRTPWIYQVDFGFEKMFSVYAGFQAAVFVKILNVFNTKNTINVYSVSDAADSDGLLTPYEFPWIDEAFINLYEAVNLKNGQSYWMVTGKQLYGHPRQILFGVRVIY